MVAFPSNFPELTLLWLQGFDYHRVYPRLFRALWGVLVPADAQFKRSVMSNRGVREPWDLVGESTDPRLCRKTCMSLTFYGTRN